MTRLRIIVLLAGLFILGTTVINAQDATTPATAQTEEEKQKQEALETKATALLEQIVGEVQLLKLPENRIRVQTAAGDLLWKRNAERARSMFSLAADGVAELMRSSDGNLQRSAAQLRQEVVLTAAQHDAALAYQLLATTRSLTPSSDTGLDSRRRSVDSNLEENLLARVAAIDPKLASQKIEEGLAKGQYPLTLAQVLTGLESQDKEAATKLTAKVVSKLQTENLLGNLSAQMLALSLLQAGPRTQPAAGQAVVMSRQQVLSESSFQDVLSAVIDAALRASPQATNQRGGNQRGRGGAGGTQTAGQLTDGQSEQQNARRLLFGVQTLLPQIDQYLPARAAAVRNKMTELGYANNPRASFNQVSNLMQQGTTESLLAAAPAAPPQLQTRLYQQAAQKALDEGDAERARQIANDHLEAAARDRVLQKIDFQLLAKKVQTDNMDELRQALGNLHSDDERIDLLLQLAAQAQLVNGEPSTAATAPGDSELARKFLGEAQRLTNRRAINYQQFEQQLKVADAFASVDPGRSFEVLDSGIAQLNELLSAAAILSGFEVSIFKDGELVLGGGSGLGNMVTRYGQELAVLAKKDFARAESSASKFQMAEPRLSSQLAIVRDVLGVPQAAPINNRFGGRGFGRRTQ